MAEPKGLNKPVKLKADLASFLGAGKFIVADAKLLTILKNTDTTSKSGKVTDLRNLKEGETIHMMQMASVVGANIE